MRRANKDLRRQESISALVAQAINSHDDAMHKHYSTVSEGREGHGLGQGHPPVSRAPIG
jgi:hypothetical protein